MAFDVAASSTTGSWAAGPTPLSGPFADLADVRPEMRALDVGCGPGSLTTELVRRLGADARRRRGSVRSRSSRRPGRDIRASTSPGGRRVAPLADGSFDVALAQLVVHFMTDPVAGLREMARVTRPGGAVAACVWDFGTGRSAAQPVLAGRPRAGSGRPRRVGPRGRPRRRSGPPVRGRRPARHRRDGAPGLQGVRRLR